MKPFVYWLGIPRQPPRLKFPISFLLPERIGKPSYPAAVPGYSSNSAPGSRRCPEPFPKSGRLQRRQFIERRLDHLSDERFIIRAGVQRDPLGDDRTDRGGFVAHESGQPGQSRTFHLEIGDPASVIVERLDLLVQMDVGRFETHPASLRRIEAGGGDGDAFDGYVAEKLGQRRIRIDE